MMYLIHSYVYPFFLCLCLVYLVSVLLHSIHSLLCSFFRPPFPISRYFAWFGSPMLPSPLRPRLPWLWGVFDERVLFGVSSTPIFIREWGRTLWRVPSTTKRVLFVEWHPTTWYLPVVHQWNNSSYTLWNTCQSTWFSLFWPSRTIIAIRMTPTLVSSIMSYWKNTRQLPICSNWRRMKNCLHSWGIFRVCLRIENSRDFSQEKHQKAALKNAYVLLNKKQYMTAVTFFLLGKHVTEAVNVILKVIP